MRILHLISSADRRGAQVFASQLVDGLNGASEHLLMAISPATTPSPLPVQVLGHNRTDLRGIRSLLCLVRSSNGVVAHGSDALLHAYAVGALTRRPFIYRNIGDPAAWGDVSLAQLRIGAPLRAARAVAALYPGARGFLITKYSLRPEQVVTIPNAVPAITLPTPAKQRSARDSFDLKPELKWIAFVGSLSEEKGVLRAIEAIANNPEQGLVIAGAGPQEGQARAAAAELAPGRVQFVGVIDNPLDLMTASDALVIPSRTEGIPAVAIEAGMSLLPVVATNVGGMSEVVSDGVTGILVDDPDPSELSTALRHAVQDRQRLGVAARSYCLANFSMQSVSRRWADLISERLT